MEQITEYYEISREPENVPYATLEIREVWIQSENKTPVRISQTTLASANPQYRALLDMLHAEPVTYAMHTGNVSVPISKSMFDTLRARTRKPMLRDLVLLFHDPNGTVIKTGCVGIKQENGFQTKLRYAEVTRTFEESPDDVPNPAEPDWTPIDNLDKRKYQIFKSQERYV